MKPEPVQDYLNETASLIARLKPSGLVPVWYSSRRGNQISCLDVPTNELAGDLCLHPSPNLYLDAAGRRLVIAFDFKGSAPGCTVVDFSPNDTLNEIIAAHRKTWKGTIVQRRFLWPAPREVRAVFLQRIAERYPSPVWLWELVELICPRPVHPLYTPHGDTSPLELASWDWLWTDYQLRLYGGSDVARPRCAMVLCLAVLGEMQRDALVEYIHERPGFDRYAITQAGQIEAMQ